jgi:outer membrane lipoprotein-sorting protein
MIILPEEEHVKKIATFCLLGLFLFAITAAPGSGQAVKDILAKMIDAQGGRKALEAIKDMTVNGSVEIIQYGMNGSLTVYQKEPDKMRMDIEIMGMVLTQGFDGEKGWAIDPRTGAAQELPEKVSESFKNQALGNDAVLNPEKYGITFTIKDKEKIQDKEYIVIEQSYKNGDKTTLYVDPDTYLIYKTRGKSFNQTGAEIEAETISSDYKKVGDMMAAHTQTVYQNGAEFMRMTFTKFSFNTGLEDSFFKMK